MKKFFLAAAMTLGISSFAFADTATTEGATPQTVSVQTVGPAWTCALTGNLSGFSISPIVSFQHLSGTGVLSCTTSENQRVEVPVRLRLGGLGVGLGFSKIDNVAVYSASIGVADDPYAIMGSYGVGATAGATLIQAGVSFDVALNVKKEGGLAFDVGLKSMDAKGLELKLQGMVFEISVL